MKPAALLAIFLGLSTIAHAADEARIVEQQGKWELAYGLVYFRVFGEVENVSKEPLPFVKLDVEWLASDGTVVHRMTGYNQRAEPLAMLESEAEREKALASIEPLAPGEKDLFRVGIAKDEMPQTPRFVVARARIVEPASTAESPPLPAPETADGGRLDVNAASKEELLELPGMNEARAIAIVNYRKANGALIQAEELALIPQIVPIYEDLRGRVRLE